MSSLDANRDGIVTRDDFTQMAYGMGLGTIGAIAANHTFNKLDRDHNGILSFEEQSRALHKN